MEWTPPCDGIATRRGGGEIVPLEEEASLGRVGMIGIDLSRHGFRLRGMGAAAAAPGEG